MKTTELAGQLMGEHARGARFLPFAAGGGITTLEQAYEVQGHFVSLQRRERASSIAGYKIGLTSPGMQAMCGITTPVAGVVLADRVHASGATLDRSHYGRLGIEFEIAIRIGSELAAADGVAIGIEEVAAAVDAVAPAIELVDDRHCDYKTLDVLSLVADNAWNAGIVLGEFRPAWPDLAQVLGSVHVDGAGAALDQGSGRDVLGNPFASVAWLASHLAQRGECLRAGDIVMTGSMVTTKFPEAAGHWRFEVSGIGVVELQVG
jgi:2-keto-4-pentenoate hydratase